MGWNTPRTVRSAGPPGRHGSDPAKAGDKATLSNFRTDCLRELKKINRAWPDLHYQTVKGALLLSPSPPRISPAPLRLIND